MENGKQCNGPVRHPPSPTVRLQLSLQELIGLRGGWVNLRLVWDGSKYNSYYSYNDADWHPGECPEDANVFKATHEGGPRDGQVNI